VLKRERYIWMRGNKLLVQLHGLVHSFVEQQDSRGVDSLEEACDKPQGDPLSLRRFVE
jgi:hypothetical protein